MAAWYLGPGRGTRVAAGLLAAVAAWCASALEAAAQQPDLSSQRVLYCVGYAHLDTQWRWDYPTTIERYLKATLDDNFERFERYPGYVFNFTGARRYALMREYYPERYERMKEYIAQGRWHVAGSSVDECDVNVPSPESILRQVLYGNGFFRRELGTESVDFMLPDCFGFPASMPSVWAHCGLKGFSTQKLSWGSAVGIPFGLGVWEGPDGRGVVAALDPGSYASAVRGRVDRNEVWAARLEANGERYGVWADLHYYGVGDVGGAPREEDVANYLASVDRPDSLFHVELSSSDQLFRDLTPEQVARLPRYRGDLLLTQHSAGSLTSQTAMKRFNRKNEALADAAERAALLAHWLGGAPYPRQKLLRSWLRVLGSQMHDILPGTSLPSAYTYAWNDEALALSGFADVLADGVGAVTRALDTRAQGVPLVVFNPLAIARDDPLQATVRFEGPAPAAVAVVGPDGRELPGQVLGRAGRSLTLLFAPALEPMSFTVFDVRPAAPGREPPSSPLAVDETSLENEHYRVTLDEQGDVASILDKAAGGRELLARPARLVFTHERPQQWPAWNMDWADRQRPPLGVVAGPARVRVVEQGPVRVALEVRRQARDSFFTQTIRLARGSAGRRLEWATRIDWQATACALRASFPLTVAAPTATYNLGLGTIERGNNDPKKYEVPAREWIDLTDLSGQHGVSILEDGRYASDKPADNELRLTLLYTPGTGRSYADQHSQDWGRHELVYALAAHQGDWRQGRSEWQGRRLNQPARAFQAPAHDGPLGRSVSWLRLDSAQVDVRAVKLAEASDEVILRVQELWGREATGVALSLGSGVEAAREVDGQERPIGPAKLQGGLLRFDLGPYQPRSFALKLQAPPTRLEPPRGTPLALPFDADVISTDADRADGALDGAGRSLPAEMLPATVVAEGLRFELGPTGPGQANALVCAGQTLALPAGDADRVYLLAAAERRLRARFVVGTRVQERVVPAWTGFVGQWDRRLWEQQDDEQQRRGGPRVRALEPGFLHDDAVAWFATHRHHPSRGNEAYRFSYLFKLGLELPAGARTLRLPDDPRVKILAVTLARNENDATRPAAPLIDVPPDRRPIRLRHRYPPPPVPVHEGLRPAGSVVMERASSFAELSLGAPAADDLADQASGGDLAFRFHDGGGRWRPHPRAGAVGGTFPRLNDGLLARNADDTERCVWYDNEGRFSLDLGRSVALAAVHTYSWHRTNRAPQLFSLWGSDATELPATDFAHGEQQGWTLLALVDTRSLGEGGVHASAVRAADGRVLGPWRHLLWVAEDRGQGTFFTEIDLHRLR